IIKANHRSFEAIQRLIDKLDVPITDGGRIHIYYLENAKAEDLASTLSSLSQAGGNKKAGGGRPRGPPPQPGQPAASVSGGGECATLFQGDVQVSADKSTNSLIIVASANDYRAMTQLIEKLDVPRRQVYVEAAILEVNVGPNTSQFGVNWHAPLRFSKDDVG